MLYEYASPTRLPTTGIEVVWACADYGSRDHHQDDQNKDLCLFVSFSFKQLIMGQTASNIASAAGSWLGGIVAHLAALIMAPILSRVSKKISPPHPLEARMDDLLEAVRDLSGQVELFREFLAARPDPAAQEMTIRVIHAPRARRRRRRRRRGEPADSIE